MEGVEALAQLLADVRDQGGRVRDIEAIEKRADGVVDETLALVRRSLFPPFPRAAIHGLINRLDDVLDLTEDAAQSLHLYHVTAVTADAQRLADLAVQAARKLKQAVIALCSSDDPRPTLVLCEEVDELERRARDARRQGMSRLFREEQDAQLRQAALDLRTARGTHRQVQARRGGCRGAGAALKGRRR